MDLAKVEEAIKLMQKYALAELKVSDETMSVRIRQSSSPVVDQLSYLPRSLVQPPPNAPTAPQAPAQASPSSAPDPSTEEDLVEVRSPFVGTFYAASAPGAKAFVRPGEHIHKGATLCIVEAMKLMNEIEAEFDGEIVKVCVKNEEPVEYDQLLFLMRK